jgi:nucleotide-binding universal stress UspA family protein
MPDPIVVAVDFAGHAFDVVGAAARLAADLNTNLVLAHVLELGSGIRPDTKIQPAWADEPLPAQEALERDAQKHLQPLVELAGLEGVGAQVCLRLGPLVPTLAACAEENGARFLVVGAHQRSGLLARFGSRTEQLVAAVGCPVMVVKPGAGTAPGASTVQGQVLAEADG